MRQTITFIGHFAFMHRGATARDNPLLQSRAEVETLVFHAGPVEAASEHRNRSGDDLQRRRLHVVFDRDRSLPIDLSRLKPGTCRLQNRRIDRSTSAALGYWTAPVSRPRSTGTREGHHRAKKAGGGQAETPFSSSPQADKYDHTRTHYASVPIINIWVIIMHEHLFCPDKKCIGSRRCYRLHVRIEDHQVQMSNVKCTYARAGAGAADGARAP
ncbi:hypothetical protein EVAR_17727_1 [Eumeta japonica]|uniref:Uncharacterized protein n=1 Tax=Eumeta variegata TaxID=151549 RepID=A0A4C1TTA2_EUMVA|nr:hypothetical protein EVAR_17727_1 [Eumeta japonica]